MHVKVVKNKYVMYMDYYLHIAYFTRQNRKDRFSLYRGKKYQTRKTILLFDVINNM